MILVTGATGNVGAELVRALADTGEPLRALTRDTPPASLPPGVTGVVGDLNQPQTLTEALTGVHAMFLLPGYQDMPGVLAAAQDAGVKRVVLLSGGSAADGDMSNAISAYMIRSEAAVQDSKMAWTIIRPSGFMSNTLQWAPQLHAGDVVRAPFPGVRIATIDPADIAAVAAETLRTAGHTGHTYTVTGPEPLLPADRTRILGEVLGRDLRFQAQSDAEARAEMSAAMPAEYVDAFFSFYADGTLDESVVLPTVQDLTDRPPRTFRQWALAHADAFR